MQGQGHGSLSNPERRLLNLVAVCGGGGPSEGLGKRSPFHFWEVSTLTLTFTLTQNLTLTLYFTLTLTLIITLT